MVKRLAKVFVAATNGDLVSYSLAAIKLLRLPLSLGGILRV